MPARTFLCYFLDGPEHGTIVVQQKEEYEIRIARQHPDTFVRQSPLQPNFRTGVYRRLGRFLDADTGEDYKIAYAWAGWDK